MEKTNGKYKYLISAVFLIIMTALTVHLLLKEVNTAEMFSLLFSVDIKYVLLGMALMVLFFMFEGISLKLVVNSLGSKVSMRSAFSYSCINSFYSFITPFGSGGQPFAIYYMMHDGIPGPKVSMATLMTLLEYKIVLIVYCVLIALIKPNLVFSNGIMVIILYVLCVAVSIAMILLIGLSMFKVKWAKKLGKWIYRILAKLNIIKKEDLDFKTEHFLMQVDDYRNGAVYIKSHPKIVIKGILYGFLQRTAFFGISCAVYMSFGMPAEMLLNVLFAEALIYMTVSSLPLPGGIGVTEKMFLIVYSTIYAPAMITPAVLLTRAINYIFAIIFSGIVAFAKQILIMKHSKAAV